MQQFIAGFATASVLWAGVVYAYHAGVPLPGHLAEEAEPTDAEVTGSPEPGEASPRRRTGRRDGDGSPRRPTPTGEGSAGDILGAPGPREIDGAGAGGEEQLAAADVEGAFDAAMPSIRRCLVLVDSPDPVVGTLRFQLRVGSSGAVTGARLSGPAAVTDGEAGSCLVGAARALRFPAFDGPEADVSYPIHLE